MRTAEVRDRIDAMPAAELRAVVRDLVLAVFDAASAGADPDTNGADLLDDINMILDTRGIHPIPASPEAP